MCTSVRLVKRGFRRLVYVPEDGTLWVGPLHSRAKAVLHVVVSVRGSTVHRDGATPTTQASCHITSVAASERGVRVRVSSRRAAWYCCATEVVKLHDWEIQANRHEKMLEDRHGQLGPAGAEGTLEPSHEKRGRGKERRARGWGASSTRSSPSLR